MRRRIDIESDFKNETDYSVPTKKHVREILEVLLDIRDLISKNLDNKKEIGKEMSFE